MQTTGDLSAGQTSEIHWKSLRYFNIYRFCIALLLFASSLTHPSAFSLLSPGLSSFHLSVTSFYLLATTFALIGLHNYRRRFNLQLSCHVLIDVLVLILLMHTDGGLRSGLGALLLVTLAGGGLVGQGRLVLFYAAMATLAVLFEQSYRALQAESEMGDFLQAGLFSAGFFAVAISARLLARRIIANEELARKRGVDLQNQTLISQRVIEEMQDGVLVLDREGWVKQHNPRAERLLGLSDPTARMLVSYSTELANAFSEWSAHATSEVVLIRAPASGMHLRARFVETNSSSRDVLVFLEDMGRLQEQARQLKLAALGRLTANIAHEIRNPLSAIKHSGELMQEESSGPLNDRLLRIVLDNAQRVERIISDVLELGRRDRAHRELIDLRQTLANFVEECTIKEKIIENVVQLELSGVASLYFDRSHFHQVMWNLLSNAVRHSRGEKASVVIRVMDSKRAGWVEVHVINDGDGIDDESREQIFEPFFTTHSQGTGLGLYIARELCEANGVRLELLEGYQAEQAEQGGAHFCLLGKGVSVSV